jgi:signal transduction histidine kinase
MVLFAERLLAGVIGAASARVLVSAVVDEEPVGIDEVMRILDETSRVIEANRQLEEKSEALERATSDLKQANARLQVLDRLKDDFVATVNHELRTPLTSIRTFSEILRDNPGLAPDERQEFLQVVVTETERLTRLIDELLDLSKIEAGGAEPDLVPLDLAAVAEDCAASMRQVFAASGVRLRLALGDQPAWVAGDRDRLVQVIVNLLGNAVKFSPPGRGRVTLGIGGDDRSVDLFVADNGPGIKPADRESVFDRFRQVGDTLTDRPGGAGLGLAICRRIVVQHGGEIWVEDGEDGGAVFKVRFARVAAPHVEPAPRRLAQMPR